MIQSMSFYCDREYVVFFQGVLMEEFSDEMLDMRVMDSSKFKNQIQIVVQFKTPSWNLRARMLAHWEKSWRNLERLKA